MADKHKIGTTDPKNPNLNGQPDSDDAQAESAESAESADSKSSTTESEKPEETKQEPKKTNIGATQE
jgi:hypothetical protein